MSKEEKYIGYIKYQGVLVEDGMMDARRQAEALLGFDSALRFFIDKQAPGFRELEFEIPVRIRKGSWEALIPETVGGWIQAGLGVVATAYFTKMSQKMAENDFADIGVKDIFRKAIEGILWFVKIGKHIGDVSIKKFENAKFSKTDGRVGIQNSKGKFLYVPKIYLDLYVNCHPKLLEKIANNIDEGRDLYIGSVTDGKVEEVMVTSNEKSIFSSEGNDLDEDVLFPELIHGENVVLEGEVTRENKTSNSMGFKYQDHILTAYPDSGDIVPFKPVLFLKCRLFGVVSRLDEKGRIAASRPKLYFSRLEPIDNEEQGDIF